MKFLIVKHHIRLLPWNGLWTINDLMSYSQNGAGPEIINLKILIHFEGQCLVQGQSCLVWHILTSHLKLFIGRVGILFRCCFRGFKPHFLCTEINFHTMYFTLNQSISLIHFHVLYFVIVYHNSWHYTERDWTRTSIKHVVCFLRMRYKWRLKRPDVHEIFIQLAIVSNK